MKSRRYYYKQIRKAFPLYPAIRAWNSANQIILGRLTLRDAKHFAATYGKTYPPNHFLFGGKP
jgi:hypothetical protein